MEPDFVSVWSRVTDAASPEAPDTQLRRFLLSEAEDICSLRTMLHQTCDAALCRLLTQICKEKTQQMKRLRAALYLLAGECEFPAISRKGCIQELLPEIRALYERVSAAAAAYRKAAEETTRTGLEIIYASLADAETRHAACLTECVERLLCLNGPKAPL